jgi:hypothetical protein
MIKDKVYSLEIYNLQKDYKSKLLQQSRIPNLTVKYQYLLREIIEICY